MIWRKSDKIVFIYLCIKDSHSFMQNLLVMKAEDYYKNSGFPVF